MLICLFGSVQESKMIVELFNYGFQDWWMHLADSVPLIN